MTRVHAQTGKDQPGPFRLDGVATVFASPVGAAGRICVTARNGATAVIRHGDDSEGLALNRLDDAFSASPALAGRQLFLRGEKHLYCIEDSPDGKTGQLPENDDGQKVE